MSVLVYNGQTFGPDNWHTLTFAQEAVADESNTETECMRISITGEIVIKGNVTTGSTGAAAGAGNDAARRELAAAKPALAMVNARTLKSRFMQRRKSLSFKVNGQELIPSGSPGAGSTIDARNGPIPEYFNVIGMWAGGLLCQLKIVSHWAEASANSEGGQILSHRWRESVRIDENLYTTKTRSGKLVVSSSSFNSSKGGQMIDGQLRDTLITASIEPGFLRTSAVYTLAENGLEMRYDLTDVEQFRMPPNPATTADGNFSATTQRMGTPGRRCQAHFTLRGPKKQEAAPDSLCSQALNIAFNKCRANGGFFPTMAVFHENCYKNEVSVTLSGMNVPAGKKIGDGLNAADNFLKLMTSRKGIGIAPVGSEPGAPVASRESRGTCPNLILHAAAYHDPTLSQTLNKQTNQIANTALGIPGG